MSEGKVDVGFVDGMQVCVLEEGVLRDGEVTSVSAKDGVTVRYADGSEEGYIPTKLEKMIADGVVERAAREQAAREKVLREEKAAREKLLREEKEAREKVLREEKEAREKAARVSFFSFFNFFY